MQKSCFSYPVELVEDVFGASDVLAKTLKKATGSETPRVLIVADMNVVQRTEGLGSRIGRYVQEHGIVLAGSPVVIVGGEKVKADNLQSALQLVSALLAAKLGRNDAVLVLGGGTILDVAGYAAAQVRGGVPVVRIPTTPAAMMEDAFADYAAVDSTTVKDALRVPSVPAAVVVDTGFAASVLDGVWRGGIGVAIRQAVSSDAALLKKLVKLAPAYCSRDMKAFAEVVSAVIASRKKHGPQSLGLWAAARLESISGYKLPYGYAVSIGLALELGYAVERGAVKAGDRESVVSLLTACGALDGLNHSGHLLGQADSLLCGLDSWMLSTGEPSVPALAGIGKATDEPPDREVYRNVLAMFDSRTPGA